MTGVEILATKEVGIASIFNFTMFWVIMGIGLGFFLIIGIASFVSSRRLEDLLMYVFFGVLIGPFFGILAGSGTAITTEYETQYKVIISDEVSMNDFLERYEIVDQEGKIYTVREITDGS